MKVNAEQLLMLLESRTFECWYERDFLDYLAGEVEAKSKEEILEDLRSLMNKYSIGE